VKLSLETPPALRTYFTWVQLIVVYVFIECALWSSRLALRNRWALATAIAVVVFLLLDFVLADLMPADLLLHERPSIRRMGLGLPTSTGTGIALLVSLAAAICLIYLVHWAGGEIPANAIWPNLSQAAGYLLWALIQEFLLQSFFFTRCEELFGASAAVWVAATLFAAAHLPSPILTTLTFIAALFFCSVFRIYRSIYPLAIVHAVLGLTVAVTMPDSLLHHMRVGIGYLRY
jgi:membrane protease YdiL (CAAX protease family)